MSRMASGVLHQSQFIPTLRDIYGPSIIWSNCNKVSMVMCCKKTYTGATSVIHASTVTIYSQMTTHDDIDAGSKPVILCHVTLSPMPVSCPPIPHLASPSLPASAALSCRGVARNFEWGGRVPKAREALFNLEMVYFGVHLRYSDALILKFCMTQCKLKIV